MLKKFYSFLITVVLFLITIIFLKENSSFRDWFNKNVLNNHIPFTKIAIQYEKLFGSPIPFKGLKSTPVFNESLKYLSKKEYDNGVILEVDNNLIPSLGSGLVIFVGKKGNHDCVIIEEEEMDVAYCMLINVGVKLYDHVEKGTYIGEVNKNVLLYFLKDGEVLNYEEFI